MSVLPKVVDDWPEVDLTKWPTDTLLYAPPSTMLRLAQTIGQGRYPIAVETDGQQRDRLVYADGWLMQFNANRTAEERLALHLTRFPELPPEQTDLRILPIGTRFEWSWAFAEVIKIHDTPNITTHIIVDGQVASELSFHADTGNSWAIPFQVERNKHQSITLDKAVMPFWRGFANLLGHYPLPGAPPRLAAARNIPWTTPLNEWTP